MLEVGEVQAVQRPLGLAVELVEFLNQVDEHAVLDADGRTDPVEIIGIQNRQACELAERLERPVHRFVHKLAQRFGQLFRLVEPGLLKCPYPLRAFIPAAGVHQIETICNGPNEILFKPGGPAAAGEFVLIKPFCVTELLEYVTQLPGDEQLLFCAEFAHGRLNGLGQLHRPFAPVPA